MSDLTFLTLFDKQGDPALFLIKRGQLAGKALRDLAAQSAQMLQAHWQVERQGSPCSTQAAGRGHEPRELPPCGGTLEGQTVRCGHKNTKKLSCLFTAVFTLNQRFEPQQTAG